MRRTPLHFSWPGLLLLTLACLAAAAWVRGHVASRPLAVVVRSKMADSWFVAADGSVLALVRQQAETRVQGAPDAGAIAAAAEKAVGADVRSYDRISVRGKPVVLHDWADGDGGLHTSGFWGTTTGPLYPNSASPLRYTVSFSKRRVVALPWWVIVLIAAGSGAILLWRGRRSGRRRQALAGLCPACGYDLRATPQRCPECGRGADSN